MNGQDAFNEITGRLLDFTADRRVLQLQIVELSQKLTRHKEAAEVLIADADRLLKERDDAKAACDAEVTRWRCISDRAERADASLRIMTAERDVLRTECDQMKGRLQYLEGERARWTKGQPALTALYETADRARLALYRYGDRGSLKRDDARALSEEIARAQTAAFDWCDQIPF